MNVTFTRIEISYSIGVTDQVDAVKYLHFSYLTTPRYTLSSSYHCLSTKHIVRSDLGVYLELYAAPSYHGYCGYISFPLGKLLISAMRK